MTRTLPESVQVAPDDLFLPFNDSVKYRSSAEEIAAVAADEKAMACFGFPSHRMHDDPEHRAIVEAARRLDLPMVYTPQLIDDDRAAHTTVIVVKQQQAWRVPAFHLLFDLIGEAPWGDYAELYESALRGYTKDDRAEWLRARRAEGRNWAGRTVYLVLSSPQVAALAPLGCRCLQPDTVQAPLPAFAPEWPREPKPHAARHLPPGVTLARGSVDRGFGWSWSRQGTDKNVIKQALLAPEAVATFNAALRGPIEIVATGA